jgi:hypothetical protein
MSSGVLIFQGMTVGVLPGDFELSVNDAGDVNSKLILSTSYNVIPIWLSIANNHFISARTAAETLKNQWDEDAEKQKSLLMSELAPSMQTIVSCGIALDALYDMLRPYAKVSQEDIDTWKSKGTSRGAQISEILRRVYKIKGETFKAFKKNITEIIKFRDMAVHPASELKNAITRPDIAAAVDWKFVAYRFQNASTCFDSTMKMFCYLYENKCIEDSVNLSITNIFLALQELGVVAINEKASDSLSSVE